MISRLSSLIALFVFVVPTHGAGGLIISEIMDGDLPGGLPKFVEVTNTSRAVIDLSGFSIGNFNNGGRSLGGGRSTVLSGSLAAGDSYVISYENGDSAGVGVFHDTYGFDPDNLGLGAFFNGDDVLVLYAADGSGTDGAATGDGADATIVDMYGVIGVNGDGEVWDYTDSYAVRNRKVTMPNATFTPIEWTFAGLNALDGLDAAGQAAMTSPGSHTFVPEPNALALLVFGLLGLAQRKRS